MTEKGSAFGHGLATREIPGRRVTARGESHQLGYFYHITPIHISSFPSFCSNTSLLSSHRALGAQQQLLTCSSLLHISR